MNSNVGLLSFPEITKDSRRPYSNKLAALMETEVSQLVAKAYFKTESLLKENYDKLKLVFHFYFLNLLFPFYIDVKVANTYRFIMFVIKLINILKNFI